MREVQKLRSWFGKSLSCGLLAGLFCVSLCEASFAQGRSTPNDNELQLWFEAPTQIRLYKWLQGYIEPSPRIGTKNRFELSQMLLRSGLIAQPTKWLQARVTYDKFWNLDNNNATVDEHRIGEQVLLLRERPKLTTFIRERLEERKFGGLNGIGVRLRTQAGLQYRLGRSPWSLLVYDELFVNLNSINGGPQGGIDRNRTFGGVTRKITKHTGIIFGYRYEYINNTDVDDEGRNQLFLSLISGF